MQIQDMFERDINRSINGVVKVAQDDETAVQQELAEYVVTRELDRHFSDFFENYERSLDTSTDRIGVWISGFFGSGKSHFLKMLSYLLANEPVAGKRPTDYFKGRFGDPMTESKVIRAATVPTQTILFNIDNKGPVDKDNTAILRVFARVFYESMGFYGEDLKVARFEKFIESQGKTEEFRSRFEEINGSPWTEVRGDYVFWADDIIETLVDVLAMSEATARGWTDGSEDVPLSIEGLVGEIKTYVDAKVDANGGQFRLLFMVDEIGQYISDDVSLMLNLQSIVEELGSKCHGSVWVVVTSQEAIDEVTTGIAGNDFSKIQGRFNTRLSLSSSSVDEVIKRRVLAKTPAATDVLGSVYALKQASLKNLFTFDRATSDLNGYVTQDEFVETYPFVGYQFKLLQNVFTQIRKHGSSGKHLASGERSMLSAFQEAAQKVQGDSDPTLVPFWMFYDTMSTFLEGHIRRVIDRAAMAAENAQGLRRYDVKVLKLLYLVLYVDDVPATLNNVSILMADNADVDILQVREWVQSSLDRLVQQNYVARNGEVYSFLTDEEQDVQREIANTPVDAEKITREVAQLVYTGIYGEAKLSVGKNVYPLGKWVDDNFYSGDQAGLPLRLITSNTPEVSSTNEALLLRSQGEVIVRLGAKDDYFELLSHAAKIAAYARTQNLTMQTTTKRRIIEDRQEARKKMHQDVQEMLADATLHGDFFVNGIAAQPKGSSAHARIEDALQLLADSVYSKRDLVDRTVDSDADILAVLAGGDGGLTGEFAPNAQAQAEVERWLLAQKRMGATTSMEVAQSRFSHAPYGWREIDIAYVVAQLISARKVVVRRGGVEVHATDRRLPDYLRKKTEVGKTEVAIREQINARILSSARGILKDFTGVNSAPQDEDALVQAIRDALNNWKDELADIASNYAHSREFEYPGRSAVTSSQRLARELMGADTSSENLVSTFARSGDDLLDAMEDLQDVRHFFGSSGSMRKIFDDSTRLLQSLKGEDDYLQDTGLPQQVDRMRQIVANPRPYKAIPELGTLCVEVRKEYGSHLDDKRRERLAEADSIFDDLVRDCDADPKATASIRSSIQNDRQVRLANIRNANSFTRLDAQRQQLDNYRLNKINQIDAAKQAAKLPPKPPARPILGGGSMTPPAPAPVPREDVRTISRNSLSPSPKLRSEQDVDDYVQKLANTLKAQLQGHDAIQVK